MSNTEIIPLNKDGARVNPGVVHTSNTIWQNIATSVSAGDEPTDLAVTERTYQTVRTAIAAALNGDEKIQIFDLPRDWNAIKIRAQGITDDGTYTTQIYLGTLGDGNKDSDSTSVDCELAYIGQFAWVIGTQSSITATYEMADTLVTTTSEGTGGTVSVNNPANNRVAEARFDLNGEDVIVIVPTVISADSNLLARGY